MSAAQTIVDAIRRIPSQSNLLNHYELHEEDREDSNAPELRRNNLRLYIESLLEKGSKDLWIGEAPSRYGARWSGVPFTHQGKLPEMADKLELRAAFATPARFPETRPSRTSDAIWSILPAQTPVLWNVVMPHPYKLRDGQVRNEETTREHHRLCRDALELVIDTFKPERVIAIGGVSKKVLKRIGINSHQVAHPGRNRHQLFWADMKKLGIG